MSKKLSTAEWIARAREKHGDRYDYSRVQYTEGKYKVEIVCPEHGSFWQSASGHSAGRGCYRCGREVIEKSRRLPTEEVIKRVIKAHGLKYIYFFGAYKTHTELKYMCPIHGLRTQVLYKHLISGCYLCEQEKTKVRQNTPLTFEEISEYIEADLDTGILTFKKDYKPYSAKKSYSVGEPIELTYDGKGYAVAALLGRKFYVHRVIWAFANGRLLDEKLSCDHINGVRDDNRASNLRAVTHAENLKNATLSSANTSGVCGVCHLPREKVYVAYITVNSKRKHLGRFKTLEEAAAVRKAAETEYGFHPLHGMSAEEKTRQ
jgi:hypothetical protein